MLLSCLLQAADRTGQVAERVLSNPTGGPEQSKRAAAQLADANAEVPKALARGAQKVLVCFFSLVREDAHIGSL